MLKKANKKGKPNKSKNDIFPIETLLIWLESKFKMATLMCTDLIGLPKLSKEPMDFHKDTDNICVCFHNLMFDSIKTVLIFFYPHLL